MALVGRGELPMSKQRKNISLPDDVNQSIDPGVNYSGLVEDWTRQYFIEGNYYAVEKAMFESMLEAVEESREQMHEQVDELHDDMAAELEAKIDHIDTAGYDEQQQTGSDAMWEEALEVLETVPRDPTNAGIKNWAGKLNVSPAELVERLNDEHGTVPDGKPQSLYSD